MTSLHARTFQTDPEAHATYGELYGMYRELHDTFGGVPAARAELGSIMKRLLALRDRVAARAPQVTHA